MDLNEKIAARRRELEGNSFNNDSECSVAEETRAVEEKKIISRNTSDLNSIQEQLDNRRRELADQDNEIQKSEKAHVAQWFEVNGTDITIEAVKRVSIATYGSMMIWSILAIELAFNHETFNGENATVGGLLLFGAVIGFLYYEVTRNEKKLAAGIMSESEISRAGIIENLKSTSVISYGWFSMLLFIFLVVVL